MKTLSHLLFGSSWNTTWAVSIGLLLLRLGTGILLVTVFEKFFPREGVWGPQQWFINDVAKMGFPMPTIFAWAAVLAEFIGGILLILGFLTRPAVFFIMVTTFVAAFVFHKEPFQQGLTAFIFFFISLSLMFTGPGRIGIDGLIERKLMRARP